MLRGHQTRPAAVPASWRGPLPDVSVQRHLNTGGGYAQVPLELVFSDISDLGVLTWTLIKLSFEDRAEVATYRQFADELGLGHLQDNAVKRRFLAAVPALIDAGWLKRNRTADNQVRYQAVVPEGAGRRYAKIRRRDIALLTSPPRGRERRQVTVAHLADFARWQLECGSRGYTAETTDSLAQHWGCPHARSGSAGTLSAQSRTAREYSPLRSGPGTRTWCGSLNFTIRCMLRSLLSRSPCLN